MNESFITTRPFIIEGVKINPSTKLSILEQVHEYDYISLELPTILSLEEDTEFHAFQSTLPTSLLFTNETISGLERDHHCTIFYGLTPNEVVYACLEEFIYEETLQASLIIKGISFFREPNSPFDVMIFLVESEYLKHLHTFIAQNFPNEDTHTDYCPHITIAYIQKNAFIENQWDNFSGFSFCNKPLPIKEIMYQTAYGEKSPLYIQ
jgi:hypothetical protein